MWRTSRNNGIIVIVLFAIIVVLGFESLLTSPLTLGIYVIILIAGILMTIGCGKKSKSGIVSGIIVGVLFVVFGGIIEKILGVFVVFDMVKLNASLKKLN